jgi:hypothetical protein
LIQKFSRESAGFITGNVEFLGKKLVVWLRVKIRRKMMKQVNFKGLNPDDLHTCQHCKHSFHDIGMNRKTCARSGQPIAPMDYIQVNDCEEYKSPYLSDYRRRTDLENELKQKKL